ncbi:MAG: DNA-binding response regulator [Chloroflexi bacterium]|nr:DNA-binding response regulator [Chloroflexota bacterium]
MVSPLRKTTLDGQLYTRRPATVQALTLLLGLSRDDVIARCSINRREDSAYVPTECLLYLVRERRSDNSEAYFERLYKLLLKRVLHALPREPSADGALESLTNAKIREAVRDRFTELLLCDRLEYDDRLDYFEVNFDGAIANLRKDARKGAWRDENRSKPLEFDDSRDLTPEVEAAAGSFDPTAAYENAGTDYRSRLDAAIDALPDLQGKIITMLRYSIPIDSKDPNAVTIAKTLGKVEKTVRNQRDKAFAALKVAMGGE